jgi:23S rRNA (uracil1939-C5)-methyltransferase
VLVPELEALIAPLKKGLAAIVKPDETVELHATSTDSGIDLSLKLKRPRDVGLLMDLSSLASSLKLARLSWNGETIAMEETPSLGIGRFTLTLPAESILQTLVGEAAAGTRNVADLFSGCGTFTLALSDGRAVHAADSAEPQIHALAAAVRAGGAKVTTEVRDLFRRPLLPAELRRFDCVVLDPPRPGAQAQAAALAQSQVPHLLYVSCNPASFARDARTLVDGGYRLTRVVPLDQFLWSPHVELFAEFTRE